MRFVTCPQSVSSFPEEKLFSRPRKWVAGVLPQKFQRALCRRSLFLLAHNTRIKFVYFLLWPLASDIKKKLCENFVSKFRSIVDFLVKNVQFPQKRRSNLKFDFRLFPNDNFVFLFMKFSKRNTLSVVTNQILAFLYVSVFQFCTSPQYCFHKSSFFNHIFK